MTHLLTRREMARKTLAGTAGILLASALPGRTQAVDPKPAVPPPLPLTPNTPKPAQNEIPMPTSSPTPPSSLNEGELLTQMVPLAAGYTLTEAQAKETALQLKDYPGGFAKARAYALPDDIGPAFAAVAPARKERVK